VRELSHEIERALIFGGSDPIDFAALGPVGRRARPPGATRLGTFSR
jgi:hypothetical protein